jgi:hypothetical protein
MVETAVASAKPPTRPTVRVRIVGGLGNQMFGAAAAMAVASRLNARLLFVLDKFKAHHDNPRNYELGGFDLGAEIVAGKDWRFSRGAAAYRLLRNATAMPGALAPSLWQQQGLHYNESIESVRGDVFLKGYMQSWRYFDAICGEVRRRFDLKPLLSPAGRALAAAAEGETSVALHIRHGDYVKYPDIHPILPADHYRRALDLIGRTVANPRLFVITDDLAAARSMLAGWPGATFAQGTQHFDDMHLMSACRHHIIANSSFSWWGAHLDARPGGLTIAPRLWFTRAVATKTYLGDLYPPGWVVM